MIAARSVRAVVLARPNLPDGVSLTSDRVRRLGIEDVVVLGTGRQTTRELLADLASCLHGRTLVVDAGLVAADASLGQLVDDPAVRSGALVAEGTATPAGGQPVRVVHRRIASAGSTLHEVSAGTGSFLGALVIDAGSVEPAVAAIGEAAHEVADHVIGADPVDLALVALVRAQVPMGAVGSVGPALRGGTPEERVNVLGELAAVDESRVLLERANRPDDGFYSTFVLRRVSKPLTSAALRLGLSPNQISLISLGVGLTAALCFATGQAWPIVLGAVLMQASLVIDCVDGEVARFTRTFSQLGAWLDAATDRVKEYAAYAGLAVGAGRGGDDIWLLAALVMIMQTVRHVGDYDFSRVQRIRESWVPARPFVDPSDGGAAGAGATLDLSAQLNRRGGVRWAKKVLHMPIGERWLVLSVGAVVLGPRWTFLVLLGLGLLALAYTTLGRLMRTRRWQDPPERSGLSLLEPQLDLGPLGDPLWHWLLGRRQPLARANGWARPAIMRIIEFGVVWGAVLVVAPQDGAPLFAWLFVVAFHHYDTLYRALSAATPPRWLVWGGLGWEGRTIAVLVAAGLGAIALSDLLTWGAAALFVLFVVIASAQWVRSMLVQQAAERAEVAPEASRD